MRKPQNGDRPPRSHKERLQEQASLAFDAMAEQEWKCLLSVTEERNLAFCLSNLSRLAEQMGVLETPLCDWSRDQIMQFLAMAVRCANPFLSPPDAATFREFSDTIPF